MADRAALRDLARATSRFASFQMDRNENARIGAIEEFALDILGIGVGITVALIIMGVVFNLLTYGSLFEQHHSDPGTTRLSETFTLVVTVPTLIILLPTCSIACVWLFRKLR